MVLALPLTTRLESDEIRTVLAIHVAEPDGLCRGCLDGARLAYAPCPWAVYALRVRAAIEYVDRQEQSWRVVQGVA